jgi:hypothetical protein
MSSRVDRTGNSNRCSEISQNLENKSSQLWKNGIVLVL